MISQDKIDRIEQYLNFEMADADRHTFETQMEQDLELAAEVGRREMAHKTLDLMIAENLRSELQAMEQQDTKVVSLASRSKRRFQLAIAASVLVLIGAFFLFLPSKSSPYQLAMSAYETPAFTLRSGNAATPADLAKGMEALESGDYESAISALEALDANSGFKVPANFYLGHANFLQGDYTKAQSYFDAAAAGNDLRYTEDAQWYATLSCLALKNNCSDKLEDISNDSNHSFIEQAKAIMLQLEK